MFAYFNTTSMDIAMFEYLEPSSDQILVMQICFFSEAQSTRQEVTVVLGGGCRPFSHRRFGDLTMNTFLSSACWVGDKRSRSGHFRSLGIVWPAWEDLWGDGDQIAETQRHSSEHRRTGSMKRSDWPSWRRSKLQSPDKSYHTEPLSSGWAGHGPQFVKSHMQLDSYTGLTGIYSSTEEQRNWHWEGLRPIYFDVSIDFKINVAVTPGALSLQFDYKSQGVTLASEEKKIQD